MPYIKTNGRQALNTSVYKAVDALTGIPDLVSRQGATNYVISRIVLGALRPHDGWSYSSISRAIATLRDAADEMSRRLMAAREDLAIEANGDLPEYEPVS